MPSLQPQVSADTTNLSAVHQQNTSVISSFTPQPLQPPVKSNYPEEDPFESEFGKHEASNVTLDAKQPSKNTSFEEIKQTEIVNTSTSSSKSQTAQDTQAFQFRINNQVVSSVPQATTAAASSQQKPAKGGFLKSAFNFMTGGMLATQAA